jgi:5-methylcytosine-specific restriction endonuclease McrA
MNKSEYMHNYHIAHRARRMQTMAAWRDRMEARAFELLGPFCHLCGESDLSVLVIDHVMPVREKNRPTGATSAYRALLSGKETPFNLQPLCANCHKRKTDTEGAQRYYR